MPETVGIGLQVEAHHNYGAIYTFLKYTSPYLLHMFSIEWRTDRSQFLHTEWLKLRGSVQESGFW